MNNYYFDLEKAIAAWRRPFEHTRAFSLEDLEELEGSLRDRVEALVEKGLSDEAAFKEALRRMGSYGTAEVEYNKVYWGKVRRRHQLTTELVWRLSMLKNYLKVALRSLLRQKGYAFINIAGLTLGMAVCLLIFQYVAFEYSFDAFNEHASALYRVTETSIRGGSEPRTIAMSPYAMGPALQQQVPEVVHFARIHPDYANPVISNPDQPDKVFEETSAFYADPDFLQMFSYPLVSGENTLAEAGTVLLSESAARRYFDDQNPIGKVLSVTGWVDGDYRIGGVFRDVPLNSHLRFDFLLPMEALRQDYEDPSLIWRMRNFITYVQLRPDADLVAVERKFTDVWLAHRGEDYRQADVEAHLNVQPLRDVHLREDVLVGGLPTGSYRTVYFFTLIGLVIFAIALINYINLATARALDRAREVGVRKSVGAERGQLVSQFLFESALTNVLALAMAVLSALALQPLVNDLADTQLTLALWASPSLWAACAAVFVASTLLAGLYPAFVLSSFRPLAALKGKTATFASRLWLRKGLVVVQFATSIVLVAGTAIVSNQLSYMRRLDLGIDLEQVLTVTGPRVLAQDVPQDEAVSTFVQELRRIPGVRRIATSSKLPGTGFNWYMEVRGATAAQASAVSAALVRIDSSFADLFGVTLVAGSGFQQMTGVTPEGEPVPVIANESAVKALGFETPGDAVGHLINMSDLVDARIVGVFRDFNWSSAHEARENIFFERIQGGTQVSLRVDTDDLPQILAAIEQTYTTLFPGNPFHYAFADEQFDQQYRSDQRFARLFSVFAGLAIVIACLGLFGLAAFTTSQRTKEIGIRKVLGASVTGIVTLLSKDYLELIVVAFVIAAPVAYFGINRWLQDFAYRIDIGPVVFMLTGALVLAIALLTVSYQAIKAALADPVKSLRYE